MSERPQAAVLVKGQITSFDPGKMIYDLLDNHWDSEIIKKPKLHFAEDSKFITFRGGDLIVLYIVSEREDPVTMGYDFTNCEASVTLDFYSEAGFRNREHLVKLIEEARRIILAHRVDSLGSESNVTGRIWMQWGSRIASFDKTTTGFRRRAVDIDIHWRFREVLLA